MVYSKKCRYNYGSFMIFLYFIKGRVTLKSPKKKEFVYQFSPPCQSLPSVNRSLHEESQCNISKMGQVIQLKRKERKLNYFNGAWKDC